MTNKSLITAQNHYDRGLGQAKKRNLHKAFNDFLIAVRLDPSMWQAYFEMASILGHAGKLEATLVCYQRCVRIAPDNAECWTRLGNTLRRLYLFDEALEALEKSLELDRENPFVYFNIGLLYADLNEFEKSIQNYDKAITFDHEKPAYKEIIVESQWSRALALLALGDYDKGWPAYESRHNLMRIPQPKFSGNLWTGESLVDQKILLTYEERFGDVIHFLRFIPYIKKLGATVIVQCPKELTRLLNEDPYIDSTVEVGENLPVYDFYLPITSIPVVLQIPFDEIPIDVPYINLRNSVVKPKIPSLPGMKLKVGMIWAGKPRPPGRSCTLSCYIPLMKRSEVGFYSFQIGPRKKDIMNERAGWLIHDLSSEIEDFYSSAVLMNEMDLIISIDSAPVHLAGGLGKPVWLMLKYSSDWRWMSDNDYNPWYPTMRVFRQEKPDSWHEVSKKLEQAFDEWVDAELVNRH
jgi:tetratricopeptide repeat protein